MEAINVKDANKSNVDSIHRAMVLIAGIDMEDCENPPRLWTALEDTYDALSDSLGTDGDISADMEEAKAIGRYFVVKSCGNAAKMRDVVKGALEAIKTLSKTHNDDLPEDVRAILGGIAFDATEALYATQRNCDRFADELDAQIEFLNSVWLISVTKDTMLEGDKFENWTEEMKSRYAKWLYAEAKGCVNGSK